MNLEDRVKQLEDTVRKLINILEIEDEFKSVVTVVPEQISPEEPEDLFVHWIEVDAKDIHVLHVAGCGQQMKGDTGECDLMKYLVENNKTVSKDLKRGEYEVRRKDGQFAFEKMKRGTDKK